VTPARATGPVIACYEDQPNGYGIIVHATLPVDVDPDEDHDFAIVDLPEIGQAATIVHRGPMDDVMLTIQTFRPDAHGCSAVLRVALGLVVSSAPWPFWDQSPRCATDH
jgi:hypothetical protein